MASEIELSVSHRVGQGAFADVFCMRDSSRVCKILRADGNLRWLSGAEAIHHEELQAYRIAAASPTLRACVARCFGHVVVARVSSASGDDITGEYLLGTAFALERLSGPCEKAGGLDPTTFGHVHALLSAFDSVGIDAGDASVFGYETARTVKFIDFTTAWGTKLLTAL